MYNAKALRCLHVISEFTVPKKIHKMFSFKEVTIYNITNDKR